MNTRPLSKSINKYVLISSRRSSRSVYLHHGPRIEGLKRDPKVAYLNPQGTEYALNEANISQITSYLGSEYQIPQDIALQCITHKSFANGIKPYNEKLAAMGSKLLNLALVKYVIHKNAAADSENPTSINGKNLSVLGSRWSRELASPEAAGYLARAESLNKTMFWTSRNPSLKFDASGELKVSSRLLYSLVGAINLYHGKAQAEKFIRENLIEGLEALAVQLVAAKK
ncbi:mitochondrial 54S ribosomal protein mL57 [Lodderomyces beijingensis]|uniref:RNase III domain-containing protein n=1 Tax=Lodderomyces beijingensis TaxID=1775926 RepID=A0ABP0ZG94_9ASCO